MDILRFLDKYVSPYKWFGKLTIDNGWGLKDKVEYFGSELTKLTNGGFELDPQVYIPNLEQAFGVFTDANGLLDLNMSGDMSPVRQEEHYYDITLDGKHHYPFVLFLHTLRAKVGVEVVATLYNAPHPNHPLYELKIIKGQSTDNEMTFKLGLGKWVPNYDNAKPVAGW